MQKNLSLFFIYPFHLLEKKKDLHEKLKQLLKDCDYTPKLLSKFKRFPDLILMAEHAETTEDAEHIYNIASSRFGSTTKREMIAEDPEREIVIDGICKYFKSPLLPSTTHLKNQYRAF